MAQEAITVPPLVSLHGVTKRFGTVVANRAVDLAVAAGEVVALVGENGAGKSTIVNLLSGQLLPDEGEVRLDGVPVRFTSPADAVGAGIGVVHQHYMLVPTLSALDNIALQMNELGLGRLDRKALAAQVSAVAEGLGFRFDMDERVDGMDVAHQQRIEIVKALMHRVRLLILDEPTAVLGAEDKAHLFETIRRLKSQGTSVILITHKLEDIFAVADRAVILKGGAVVAARPAAELSPGEIVRLMVGARDAAEADAIVHGDDLRARRQPHGELRCAIRDVTLRRANGSVAIAGLSLDIHAGEIVAVAGVDGNGQSELMRCIAGMKRPDGGVVECLGESSDSRAWTPAGLRRLGLSHIPEDRRRSGIVGAMSLARNYLLGHMRSPNFVRMGMLRQAELDATVARRLVDFQVVARGPQDRMQNLSGGNQQKVVLARELDGDPKLILAAHPSRGLDLKTIRFVHSVLDRARTEGKAVLFQSSDLDEILALADRVVVFADGRAFGPARCDAVTRDQLGAWIAGHEEIP